MTNTLAHHKEKEGFRTLAPGLQITSIHAATSTGKYQQSTPSHFQDGRCQVRILPT